MTVFPLELTYQVKKRADIIFVIFDGPDKTILLRNDGSLLLAIQHVLNKISPVKVQVDCEFYRKRKEKKLRDYAQRLARQVSDSGREEVLDLMNPYERRIIHIVANETPGVTSESIGEGFFKKVKIFVPLEDSPSFRRTTGASISSHVRCGDFETPPVGARLKYRVRLPRR
jgi:spoIIIJ-associated protein